MAAQNATPVSADEASSIEPVSGQALYSLPRDHRWHGGPFYTTGAYWEWHYWPASSRMPTPARCGTLLHVQLYTMRHW